MTLRPGLLKVLPRLRKVTACLMVLNWGCALTAAIRLGKLCWADAQPAVPGVGPGGRGLHWERR